MLMVVFRLGHERYAVRADCVVEIVPLVALKLLPQAPPYVAGLFNYRARVTPVIDLCKLALGRRCEDFLSSRIILIDYDRVSGMAPNGRGQILGLLAEQVTETCTLPSSTSASPVNVAQTPYLGEIFYSGAELNQCVEVSKLLPDSVRELLFAQCAGGGD